MSNFAVYTIVAKNKQIMSLWLQLSFTIQFRLDKYHVCALVVK